MNSLIELIYSVTVGIVVALFVCFGIWSLHPGPEYPERTANYSTSQANREYEKQQREEDKRYEKFEKKQKSYALEVAVIALIASAVFYAIGPRLIRTNEVLRDGFMFGGIFTVIYALMHAAESENRIVVFASISLLLAMVVWLAHVKFQGTRHKK